MSKIIIGKEFIIRRPGALNRVRCTAITKLPGGYTRVLLLSGKVGNFDIGDMIELQNRQLVPIGRKRKLK